MPYRCVAGGCSRTSNDGVSMHKFPTDASLASKWSKAIRVHRADWTGPSSTSRLCSLHFTSDCYDEETVMRKKMRLEAKRLNLKESSIPTLFPSKKDIDAGSETWWSGSIHQLESSSDEHDTSSGRVAFRKRQRSQVVDEILQASFEVPRDDTQVEEEVPEPSLPAITQRRTSSKSIQTCIRPRRSSRGCQVAIATVSIGVQCDLINCGPLDQPAYSTPDVSDDDLDMEGSDTGSEDHNGCNNLDDTFQSIMDTDVMEEASEDEYNYGDSDEEDVNLQSLEEDIGTSKEAKFIVYYSALILLLQHCACCASQLCVNKFKKWGTSLRVMQSCKSCGYERTWQSQPMLGRQPAGNLHLSASILFTGGSPTQFLRALKMFSCASITVRTFFRHQAKHLQPAVMSVWKQHQREILTIAKAKDAPLILGGDGRADSPGHSAKYGSYSVLDCDTNKVLDMQLVQSNEVPGSTHMEKEGLIRCVTFLQESGLTISKIVTDRHKQIGKWIREELPTVKHEYDVWHVAKGLKKKLDALRKEKDCALVSEWKRSLINHLYWCGSSSEGNGDIQVAKWDSVADHIQNIHRHDNPLFPRCTHGRLNGRKRKKKWLKPGTKACEKVLKIITSTYLRNDVRKLSSGLQTSSVEAFHSVVNHFAPKLLSFSYEGMTSRLLLAALHFNENSSRAQATLASGEGRYKISHPKFKKGGHTVRKIRVPPTYGYVNALFEDLYKNHSVHSQSQDHAATQVPPPLSSAYEQPSKEEAIARHKSRYSQSQ